MAVGVPAEQANRLGYEDRVPLDGNGTTQGSATELLTTQTNVALGTSVGDTAFRLPAEAEYFQEYFLLNTTAETALIFPPVGDTVDANALNASVGIDTDLARVFMRVEEGRWVSMPSGEGGGGIESIVAGTGINVDNTDPDNPVVSNDGVLSVSGGAGVSVDITDPQNPVVINTGVVSVTAGSNVSITGTPENPTINADPAPVDSVNGQTGAVVIDAADVGAVATIQAGTNITVDATDPQNPIVSATVPPSGVETIVAGTGIDVDATDPANPIVALEPAEDVRNYLDTGPYVADRTALAALDTTKDTVAWLKEAGREGSFQWSAANLSALVTADPQQGLYVAPASAPTGAAGAWVRQFDGPTDPRWFGAIGDNSADNATAFASWIAVSAGWLVLPPGRFRTSGAISIDLDTTPTLTIQGASESLTELTYTGTGDFITVERTTGIASLVGMIIEGITFVTTQAGTANAMVLELDNAAPSVGSYETLARRVSNCRFLPEGAGDYWGEAIRWNNTTFGTTENITVRGDATTSGNCVVYGGTRSAVDNIIHNLKGVSVDTLVLVENDTQEGLYISQLVGVSILRGVDWQVTGTPAPALVVDGGHLNVKAGGYAFLIDNVNAPFFSNLTVYLDGASPTGFSLDNDIAYAMNPSFSNVSVFGLGGSSNTTGLVVGAGVNRAVIGGISFNDLTTGMVLTGGMKDVTVTPAVGFYNCTTNISESGNIWVPTDRNRVWKGTDSEQRFSLANNTGLNFTLENLSVSGAAKWVGLVLQGRNSLGSLRGVGVARWTSQDVNWVNSDIAIGNRRADAEVTALAIRADGLHTINGSLSRGSPVTKTGNFTWAITENWILNNKGSACVATLPAAASFPGRELHATNIGGAFALTSASSNVVPKAGGAAGTAILPATDGVWATLVSDGTNWVITQAGT